MIIHNLNYIVDVDNNTTTASLQGVCASNFLVFLNGSKLVDDDYDVVSGNLIVHTAFDIDYVLEVVCFDSGVSSSDKVNYDLLAYRVDVTVEEYVQTNFNSSIVELISSLEFGNFQDLNFKAILDYICMFKLPIGYSISDDLNNISFIYDDRVVVFDLIDGLYVNESNGCVAYFTVSFDSVADCESSYTTHSTVSNLQFRLA